MTDIDVSRPVLNGGEDSILDDGEEAETKVYSISLGLDPRFSIMFCLGNPAHEAASGRDGERGEQTP